MNIARTVAFCVALLSIGSLFAADEIPPPQGEVVPEGARLEHLFTRSADISGGLTEGPAAAPDGSIYFSDIPFGDDKGMILRFNPRTMKTSVFTADSGKANGLIFDGEGNLLACEGAGGGGRRVSRWNVKTKERTTIAGDYMGKHFNSPNDICLDAKGRIYFSDPRYVGDEPRELEHRAIYRIDRDGGVHEATHNIVKPNGIAISPDGKTLYAADHDNGTDNIDPTAPAPEQGVMRIYAFELDDEGNVGKRRTVLDFGGEKGCDGMCVDSEGRIYLTVRSGRRPGVLVITPAGKEVAHIPTGPADQTREAGEETSGLPSNVEFGRGEDSDMLYITVDTSLYRIRLNAKGWHVQTQGKDR